MKLFRRNRKILIPDHEPRRRWLWSRPRLVDLTPLQKMIWLSIRW